MTRILLGVAIGLFVAGLIWSVWDLATSSDYLGRKR